MLMTLCKKYPCSHLNIGNVETRRAPRLIVRWDSRWILIKTSMSELEHGIFFLPVSSLTNIFTFSSFSVFQGSWISCSAPFFTTLSLWHGTHIFLKGMRLFFNFILSIVLSLLCGSRRWRCQLVHRPQRAFLEGWRINVHLWPCTTAQRRN